jgi:F-type H+-transporting ATPase subunit delta
MKQTKVAFRYAKSLLDLSVERGVLDQTQADMDLVSQTIIGSKDFSVVLHSPIINSDKKEVILKEIFGDKVSTLSMSFMDIINRKGREGLLGQISSSFVVMSKEYKNIYGAEVTSAHPLSDDARARIEKIVRDIKQGEVELAETIDPNVIGGFILRIGDNMVDASVSSKIRDLKQEFSENPYVPEL